MSYNLFFSRYTITHVMEKLIYLPNWSNIWEIKHMMRFFLNTRITIIYSIWRDFSQKYSLLCIQLIDFAEQKV